MDRQKIKAMVSVLIAAVIIWFILPFPYSIAAIAAAIVLVWISYRRNKPKAKGETLDKQKSERNE
jgi:chromate transport protein ChrA